MGSKGSANAIRRWRYWFERATSPRTSLCTSTTYICGLWDWSWCTLAPMLFLLIGSRRTWWRKIWSESMAPAPVAPTAPQPATVKLEIAFCPKFLLNQWSTNGQLMVIVELVNWPCPLIVELGKYHFAREVSSVVIFFPMITFQQMVNCWLRLVVWDSNRVHWKESQSLSLSGIPNIQTTGPQTNKPKPLAESGLE